MSRYAAPSTSDHGGPYTRPAPDFERCEVCGYAGTDEDWARVERAGYACVVYTQPRPPMDQPNRYAAWIAARDVHGFEL